MHCVTRVAEEYDEDHSEEEEIDNISLLYTTTRPFQRDDNHDDNDSSTGGPTLSVVNCPLKFFFPLLIITKTNSGQVPNTQILPTFVPYN